MTGSEQPRRGSVVRNTAALAVARIADRVATFVVVILIAGKFGTEGLGVYATALALFGVMAIAGYAGSTQYLVGELSRRPENTSSYTTHLSVVGVIVAAVLIAAGQLIVPLLGYSPGLERGVSIILFALLPKVLNTIQEAVFLAHGRVAFEATTRSTNSVLYVGIAVVLLVSGHGVSDLLIAYVLLEYGITCVYFVLIHRHITHLSRTFDWRVARHLVGEMRTFTASSFLAALFARPEVVILSLVASESQVGVYSAALRLAELPIFLPDVLMANAYPRLATAGEARDMPRFQQLQTNALRAIAAFSFPLAGILIAGAGPLVGLVYGSAFDEAGPLLQLMTATLVCTSLATVFWRVLPALDRQALVLRTQVIVIAVRLSVGTAVIAIYAADGAAISSAGAAVLNVVLLGYFTRKAGSTFDLVRSTGWFALGAAVAGLLVWLLDAVVPVYVAGALGGLAYLIFVVVLPVLNPVERRLVLKIAARR